MTEKKRGQISIEYLIIISFVTFIIITVLGVALYYSVNIRDSIKFAQLETFANKVTKSSEEVFYAGTPSKTTLTAYLPDGVSNVTVGSNYLLFKIATNSGTTVIAYTSQVPLQGTLTTKSGVKRIQIAAQQNNVLLTEG